MSEADPKVQADSVAGAAGEKAARKAPWRLALMLSVPLVLAIIGGYMWLTSGRYVSTDNAYVQQDMVTVAPEVNGRISEVLVRENQQVRRGDLLFRIDPRPFRIALAQADAQIAAAQVQVNQLETRSAGTGADIEGAEANLVYQQREYARLDQLMGRGWITRSRHDEALHNLQEARERLANARAEAATARSALQGGGPADQPALQAARVAREQALLNLARTEVRAPSDGTISQTDRLQIGATAVTGVPVVTLVRGATTYVEANYKETDLANMYVGQSAEVTFDAYPGVRVHGHVASIGAGTGSQFSVLPAQNASGNWVKVTQRLAVRLALDEDPGRPMLAGLSAHVTIDTRERPPQRAAAVH
ncbi:MAG: rane fusion protein multidrug efflux system [Sphingomonadales bacterium]|jgi:membrane fusion protein (multidrug efflux system)|nr:rane fusion protein multidrug efflux system [Sphingomonadales bacterium]